MMCEWLSSNEWCDVQLQCNGHIFSAHRAVLASVSSFLKKVLLSCPAEDSNAFIILPEFDLDAMSSVLYYIYHGEVIIPQCRIKMFLDIIRTMQIFVDYHYLPNISEGAEKSHLDLSMYRVHNLPKSNDMTSLDSVNNKDQQYVYNLRNDVEIKDIVYKVQCSFDGLDYREKQIRRCSCSEKLNSSSGDLKLRCEDRQRGSFLRDLFIETYAQNGNGNGRTAGVLAISNKRYRGPTSVLFTNANSRDPSANDTLSETSKTSSGVRFPSSLTSYNTVQPNASFYLSKKDRSETFSESVINQFNKNHLDLTYLLKNRFQQDIWMKNSHLPVQLNKNRLLEMECPTLDLRIPPTKSKVIDPEYEHNYTIKNKVMDKYCKEQILETNAISNNKINLNPRNAFTKVVILNEVLESPWCPRNPFNYYYKPFRRKRHDILQLKADNLKNEFDSVNDKNNNINVTIPLLTPTETTEKNSIEIRDASVTSRSLRVTNELKCTTCNQVFTSDELFSSHMRRHTALTRYRCEECYKTFSQLRNFKYHMSVHRGTKEFATTCPVCGKYFNDRGYLSSHMKIHRNRKEYKCSMCPKSFNQRVAYNMHVRIHTGVKPHVCDDCGKAFSRKMLLKQHQRTHSGERPYACPHCDKRFADRSNMTLHLRLHTGIKPFSCSLCPKSFTKKHHLKSHLNFHTGAKPYSCPRCNLTFTQSSNMRTHFKKCSAPETIQTDTASSKK